MQSQQGSSLIEILVTVVIVSIGLLGLAILQANSLRFNQDAYFRSVATAQAESMADRMRANPTGVAAGNYNAVSAIGSGANCSASCTAANIALQDIFEWNTQNAAVLPSGLGTVTVNNGMFTITVRWETRQARSNATACGSTEEQKFTCLSIGMRI